MIFGIFGKERKKREPEEGCEYIYNYDIAYSMKKFPPAVHVDRYSIVTDVVRLEDDSFTFKLKDGDGEVYSTNYGFHFVENTKENVSLLEEVNEQKKILNKLVVKLNDQTLSGPVK